MSRWLRIRIMALAAVGVILFAVPAMADGGNPRLVWQKTLVQRNTVTTGLALDSTGNAYVSGDVPGGGTYDFGDGVVLKNLPGDTSIGVLVKYSPSGKTLWAVSIPGSARSGYQGVAVSADGRVAAVGSFYGKSTRSFGAEVAVTGLKDYNPLVVVYNSNGKPLWAWTHQDGPYIPSQVVGEGFGAVNAAAFDAEGDLVIGGYSVNTLYYGNGVVSQPRDGTHLWASAVLLFAAGFGRDGKPRWALAPTMAEGTLQWSGIFAAATDRAGRVILSGFINGKGRVTLDGSQFLDLPSVYKNHVVLAVDHNGQILWQKSTAAGSGDGSFGHLSLDVDGNMRARGLIRANGRVDWGDGFATEHPGASEDVTAVYSPDGTVVAVEFPSRPPESNGLTLEVYETYWLFPEADGLGGVVAYGGTIGKKSFALGNGMTLVSPGPGVHWVVLKYTAP